MSNSTEYTYIYMLLSINSNITNTLNWSSSLVLITYNTILNSFSINKITSKNITFGYTGVFYYPTTVSSSGNYMSYSVFGGNIYYSNNFGSLFSLVNGYNTTISSTCGTNCYFYPNNETNSLIQICDLTNGNNNQITQSCLNQLIKFNSCYTDFYGQYSGFFNSSNSLYITTDFYVTNSNPTIFNFDKTSSTIFINQTNNSSGKYLVICDGDFVYSSTNASQNGGSFLQESYFTNISCSFVCTNNCDSDNQPVSFIIGDNTIIYYGYGNVIN